MRTYYWYLTAFLKKQGGVLLVSFILALFFFSFAVPAVVRNIDFKSKQYIGIVGNYPLEQLPEQVQQKISRGLSAPTEDGSFIPDLSERWTVEDGGKAFRFILKKNIFWHDGEPFTPADVNYTFRDVEVVTTQNDVVFKLPDIYVPFPSIVSQPITKIVNEKYLLFFTRPTVIGLGDYRVVDYKRRGRWLSQLTIESPKERLVYRFYPTEDDALLAFKHGEVDVLTDFSSPYDLGSWPTVTVTPQLHKNRYLAVFFNNESALFTKNVRQALSYALSKPEIDVRANSPISPTSWAYLKGVKTYDYDIDRALERLLSELPSQPLNFELTTTSTFLQQAENIQKQWQEFGERAVSACENKKEIKDKNQCQNLKITVSVRVNNYPDTNNFQALLIGQEVPDDPDQYYLWHSNESSNFTRYKNTRIDSLLEKGRTTLDRQERVALYQEFQQFFLEDAPVIFLRYLESYDIARTSHLLKP